jgi:prephenate dehydratase
VSVRSHVVALGSSRRWLAEHLPDVEQLASASTARAAQEVAELGTLHAAIVNPLAAERYGLEVLAEGLADRAGNMTRFVMVGDHVPAPTGWDKTSLVVFIDTNRPGALLQLLEVFAARELNLTKIESRPTKTELGEYCFFVDVEGHLSDERVGDALATVKRTQRDVRLLGSYRRSGRAPACRGGAHRARRRRVPRRGRVARRVARTGRARGPDAAGTLRASSSPPGAASAWRLRLVWSMARDC